MGINSSQYNNKLAQFFAVAVGLRLSRKGYKQAPVPTVRESRTPTESAVRIAAAQAKRARRAA